ncbi:MAG TPA: molybdopterin-dependent oxidoreductase [Thermoleophilia bacterium]|nr:molybdopterin-dependent oxidoreductase [Thermoleophilia bacterium]
MTDELRVVGRDHPIADAALKVSGALVYATDMRLPRMLYAKLLLSPIAHGRVAHIDATEALALPGVVAVFSHENAPQRLYSRYRLLPDQDCPEDEPLFAETVRFAGDRVAAVVAEGLDIAAAAVRLLRVQYEELPAVLTAEEALREGAIPIHPGGNLLSEFEHAAGERPEARGNEVTVTVATSLPRAHHAALEPHSCIADCDASGKLTMWSPTQSVFGARTVVADLLGLSYSQVRVIKVPMGGSFGGKQEFTLEPVTAFMAMTLRRPVRLALEREECISSTMVRGASTSTVRVTADPAGVLKDLEVDTLFDAGAYGTSSIDYVDMMTKKLTRLYRVPQYRHHCRVVYTTTPVAGGCRAWGAVDITAPMEIAMDRLAGRLGMDPVELRLKNLVEPFDRELLTGAELGDARIRECLVRGAEAFRWDERVQQDPGRGRYRRGVGVACGAHKNGMLSDTFPDFSTMTLKMNEDGSVALGASLHEVGCGAVTAMRLIVAEELGIEPEMVSVTEADSDLTPYDFGCYGSRVTYVCGAAARQTAVALKERLLEVAAVLMGRPVAELCFRGGRIEAASAPGEGLAPAEAVMAAKTVLHEDVSVQSTHQATSNPGAYSAQFAEVVVDTWTGLTRVTDFLAVGDVGRAINRAMVVGQYQGAVQMGIGFALCEEVGLDTAGRVVPGGFKQYHVVNTPDMPDVKVILVEHDGDDGPYGAKSVGEISVVPTVPAVVNAVNRALGTSLSDLPLTPAKVVAALR